MLLLTIKKRTDFVNIGSKGVVFHAKTVLVVANQTPKKYLINPADGKEMDFCRFGYTVTKKIGGAVVRNKIKRRLREVVRKLYLDLGLNHYDYVIIAKREAAGADFESLKKDVRFCLKILKKKLEG